MAVISGYTWLLRDGTQLSVRPVRVVNKTHLCDVPFALKRLIHRFINKKTSDTALLSVIALTTFNCIVSASVTKGALVCFVETVHWWRHRIYYDVTEACRALRNILTVHSNNEATRADMRRIPKHCEVTAKTSGRQSTIYTGGCDEIFFITRYGINPYSYSGFYAPVAVLEILNRGSSLWPSGFTWQVASARLAGDVIKVWINSSPSNHCISHSKAQLGQLFFIQHLICTYWIKGILWVGLTAADFPRDVCLTVSRNHKVFLLYAMYYT